MKMTPPFSVVGFGPKASKGGVNTFLSSLYVFLLLVWLFLSKLYRGIAVQGGGL